MNGSQLHVSTSGGSSEYRSAYGLTGGGQLVNSSPAQSFVAAVAAVLENGLAPLDVIRMCEKLVSGKGVQDLSPSEVSGSSVSGVSRSTARRRKKGRANEEKDLGFAKEIERDYPYLLWIQPRFRDSVMASVGPTPTLLQVLSLPVSKFMPMVAVGLGPTLLPQGEKKRQLVVDVGRAEGVSLLSCARGISDMQAGLVDASWMRFTPKAEPAKVSCSDRLMGLSLSVEAARVADLQGFCYLRLFPVALRVMKCGALGKNPLLGKVAVERGSNPECRVAYRGDGVWHVGEADGDFRWGDLAAAVRNGAGFLGFSKEQLRGHVLGAEISLREECHEAIREAADGDRDVVYVIPTGKVHRMSSGSELVSGVSGAYRATFPGFAVVKAEWGVFVFEKFSLEVQRPTLFVFDREVSFSHEGSKGFYVKTISTSTWAKLCVTEGFLPHYSSAMRLAYKTRSSALILSDHVGGARVGGGLPVKQVHDVTDKWLAMTEVEVKVSSAGVVPVESVGSVAVCAEEGSLTAEKLVRISRDASIVFVRRGPLLGSVLLEPIEQPTVVRVVGIADDYAFAAGGPDIGEDCCSGEEFGYF